MSQKYQLKAIFLTIKQMKMRLNWCKKFKIKQTEIMYTLQKKRYSSVAQIENVDG